LRVTEAASGTTLPATPPSTGDRLELLGKGAAVEDHLSALPRGHAGKDRRQPVDGVAPREGTCGVGAHATEPHRHAQRALAAGLHLGVGRLAQMATSHSKRSGRSA